MSDVPALPHGLWPSPVDGAVLAEALRFDDLGWSASGALLWLEYREAQPDGFGYSWFCHAYRAWQGRLDLVMRGEHRAGEKLFVGLLPHT